MTDLKLIEKIQKMLELGRRGGTEAEMETAMRKVHELLAKYNLTMQEVKTAPDSTDTTVVKESSPVFVKRGRSWHDSIWYGIAELYFCTYFRSVDGAHRFAPHYHHVLVGRPSNIAVAKEMILYIISVGENLGQAYRHGSSRNAFKVGFGLRIAERADAELRRAKADQIKDNDGTALILSPLYDRAKREAEELLASEGVHLVLKRMRTSTSDEAAFSSGRHAADKVSLKADGIGSSAAPIATLGRGK